MIPRSTLKLSLTDPQQNHTDHPLGVLNTVLYTPAKRKELFENTIFSWDEHPRQALRLLTNTLEDQFSKFYNDRSSYSMASDTDDERKIFLCFTVERFSSAQSRRLCADGIEVGQHEWNIQVKEWYKKMKKVNANRYSNVKMVSIHLHCKPVEPLAVAPAFEATFIIRNAEYSMTHLSQIERNH